MMAVEEEAEEEAPNEQASAAGDEATPNHKDGEPGHVSQNKLHGESFPELVRKNSVEVLPGDSIDDIARKNQLMVQMLHQSSGSSSRIGGSGERRRRRTRRRGSDESEHGGGNVSSASSAREEERPSAGGPRDDRRVESAAVSPRAGSASEKDDGAVGTNEWDASGRCVRHSHVRLRKKKVLGKGWKVLMSGKKSLYFPLDLPFRFPQSHLCFIAYSYYLLLCVVPFVSCARRKPVRSAASTSSTGPGRMAADLFPQVRRRRTPSDRDRGRRRRASAGASPRGAIAAAGSPSPPRSRRTAGSSRDADRRQAGSSGAPPAPKRPHADTAPRPAGDGGPPRARAPLWGRRRPGGPGPGPPAELIGRRRCHGRRPRRSRVRRCAAPTSPATAA